MKTTINLELSLEHIHPDLYDIPVEVELDVYEGSDNRLSSDDPSEIDIVSINVLEEIKYIDFGVNYTIFKNDQIKILDKQIEKQIFTAYERSI